MEDAPLDNPPTDSPDKAESDVKETPEDVSTASMDSKPPVSSSGADDAPGCSGPVEESGMKSRLSPDAPAFEPRKDDPRVEAARIILEEAAAKKRAEPAQDIIRRQTEEASANVSTDHLAWLPWSHRSMLRGYFEEYDPSTGMAEWLPYYVGTLKSFSNQKGYGFLSCAEVEARCGGDVFIHQKHVPIPWQLGTPVEFAVVLNNHGQPQAADVKFLPPLPKRLPVRSPTNIFSPNPPTGVPLERPRSPQSRQATLNQPPQSGNVAPSSPARATPANGSNSTSPVHASPKEQAILANQLAPEKTESRYIGTLKSFSTAKGYGFFACPDFQGRDVYLDKSLLPQHGRWELGQTVEFSVNLNNRGQPQAREVNWSPVPLLPSQSKQTRKVHSESIRDTLRKLLQQINSNQLENALIMAIDAHGDQKGENSTAEPDADYVVYVLERTDEQRVQREVKDFVKLLLLLMVSKMLRKASIPVRVETLNHWLQFVAEVINISSILEHYASVVDQVQGNLRNAVDQNPAVSGSREAYDRVVEKLRAKVPS